MRISLTLLAVLLFAGFVPLSSRADESDAFDAYYAPVPPPVPNLRLVNMTRGDRFAPSQLTIRVGDTVQWVNRDDEAHTVTDDPSKARVSSHARLPLGATAWDSGDIPAGRTFTKTFTVPGQYVYFCKPHEMHGMIGVINVVR